MEENSSRGFKIITFSLLIFAFGLVVAGSYFAGRLRQLSPKKVLGTEETALPTLVPTEIPSLADETTPTPTPSPTPRIDKP